MTQDNGLDVSPSWRELSRRVEELEAQLSAAMDREEEVKARLVYATERAERQRHLEAQLQGEINGLEAESNALAERVAELERYNLGLANESHELKTELRRQAEGGE